MDADNLVIFEKILLTLPQIIELQINGNKLFLLCEKYNLTGSIKVKPVYYMIQNAIKNGNLNSQKIILEASSGNTAIALAFFGKILGLKVKIVLSKTTSSAKKNILKSFGVSLVEVDGNTDKAVKKRDELYKENPDLFWVPDQFSNWDNFYSHYYITAKTLKKLGKIDFLIAGLGTGATLLGTGKSLKQENKELEIVAVNPIERIEGLRNFLDTDLHIPFFDENKYLISSWINVNFKEAKEGFDFLKERKILAGVSSGAAIFGAIKYLKSKKNLKGVVILPDGVDYYDYLV